MPTITDSQVVIDQINADGILYLKSRLSWEPVIPDIRPRSDDTPETALIDAYLESRNDFKERLRTLMRELLTELCQSRHSGTEPWAGLLFPLIAGTRMEGVEDLLVDLLDREISRLPSKNRWLRRFQKLAPWRKSDWWRLPGPYKDSLLLELTVALRAVEKVPKARWIPLLEDPHTAGAAFGAITEADTTIGLVHFHTLMETALKWPEETPLCMCIWCFISASGQQGRGGNPALALLDRAGSVKARTLVMKELRTIPSAAHLIP
ncbi:MAG: hypothetical protein RLZZ347_213 [Candidatus Parcubacteria bacterium]|jgi:hypothetical protein